jgi:DNA polymerase-3 subunit epsilon
MKLPFQETFEARRTRRALPPALREQLRRLRRRIRATRVMDQPLALARFVAIDLETTGPDMHRDRIIAIGAVAVADRAVQHGDAFEALVRQQESSRVDNILIHRIGGQEQLSGSDPVESLAACLEFLGASPAVAFRAEFDAAVLHRELRAWLGLRSTTRFIDLACILPALFPGTPHDSLDDWAGHFGLPPIGRHHAVADAYANAQLLMLALEKAQRLGMNRTRDLFELERAQRWLGRRR